MEEKRIFGMLYVIKETTSYKSQYIYRYKISCISEKDIESDMEYIRTEGGSWDNILLFIVHIKKKEAMKKIMWFVSSLNRIPNIVMRKKVWMELGKDESERFDSYLLCLYKNILHVSVTIEIVSIIKDKIMNAKDDIMEIDEYLSKILCYIRSLHKRV